MKQMQQVARSPPRCTLACKTSARGGFRSTRDGNTRIASWMLYRIRCKRVLLGVRRSSMVPR